VDPIVDLAVKGNYKKRLCQIFCILGTYYAFVEEDLPKSIEYAKKSLKVGQEINDLITLVLSNNLMGGCLFLNCEFEKALIHYEKSLAINVLGNVSWGISAIKTAIAWFVYAYQGKIDLAYQSSNEALRIADESGDIYSKAHAYTAHGWSNYCKGYLEEAKKSLLKGADFSEKINSIVFFAHANANLGLTYFDSEKYKLSQKHYERAISLYQHSKSLTSNVSLCKIALALAKVMDNDKNINLNEIFECFDNNKFRLWEGIMQYYIGDIFLNIDNNHITEADDWIKKAIEADTRNGMMWNLARDYALYAELFKRKGDLTKARENLSKAIEIFKECGADGWAEKYEKELASLA
jgi:tetratricopeptide (TPR) repeat protein